MARNIAIVSFPPVSVSHVSRFASAAGTAARQVAACRSPASVASADSSASIVGLAEHPPADQAAQQGPAQVGVDGEAVKHHRRRTSSPDSSSRSAAEVATPANERSVGELVVRARPARTASSDRSDDAIRASPSARQDGSAYWRTASAACRSSVCTTLMSRTESTPPSTSRT